MNRSISRVYKAESRYGRVSGSTWLPLRYKITSAKLSTCNHKIWKSQSLSSHRRLLHFYQSIVWEGIETEAFIVATSFENSNVDLSDLSFAEERSRHIAIGKLLEYC